ncbi:hypothetical protein MBLNU459_g1153t1 [Dothideomycetes sp. NU459]
MESASTAAVLLLNLPPSALGGIDLLSFTTTPRFQGIKNLPSGFHFVFAGSTSSLSIRHGAWIQVSPTFGPNKAASPDLFIQKWDPAAEELVPETDAARILHWRANLGSIWREGLTPYRQSAVSQNDADDAAARGGGGGGGGGGVVEDKDDWRQLTDCISPPVLSRILDADPRAWTLTSASSAKQDMDDIPGLSAAESRARAEKELHFLPVDLRRTWREGATGRERTDAAQDRSWALGELVARHCAGDRAQLLGELQFCFLMVLTLNNYSCLEQWRRLLALALTCRAAVGADPPFFVRLLATLKMQLQHSFDADGGGLFDMSDDGAGFLRDLLGRFRRALDRLPGHAKQDVMDELDDLLDYLHDSHGWGQLDDGRVARSGIVQLEDGEEVEMDVAAYDDEDGEEGEYAPQVVDLSPEQMRLLGIEHGGLDGVGTGNATPTLRERIRKDQAEADERGESDDDEGLYEDDAEVDEMDARY